MAVPLNEAVRAYFREKHRPNNFMYSTVKKLAASIPQLPGYQEKEVDIFYFTEVDNEASTNRETGLPSRGRNYPEIASLEAWFAKLPAKTPLRMWTQGQFPEELLSGFSGFDSIASRLSSRSNLSKDEIFSAAFAIPGEPTPQRGWQDEYMAAANKNQFAQTRAPLKALRLRDSGGGFYYQLAELLTEMGGTHHLHLEIERLPWESWTEQLFSQMAKEWATQYTHMDRNPAMALLHLWRSYCSKFTSYIVADYHLVHSMLAARGTTPVYQEVFILDSSRSSSMSAVLEQSRIKAKRNRHLHRTGLANLYESLKLCKIYDTPPSDTALNCVKHLELMKRLRVPPEMEVSAYDTVEDMSEGCLDEWWNLVFMRTPEREELAEQTEKWFSSL